MYTYYKMTILEDVITAQFLYIIDIIVFSIICCNLYVIIVPTYALCL